MALNVPEDLAMVIVEAIEASEMVLTPRQAEDHEEALYDLADTIRGTISNTPNGTDVAVSFTA